MKCLEKNFTELKSKENKAKSTSSGNYEEGTQNKGIRYKIKKMLHLNIQGENREMSLIQLSVSYRGRSEMNYKSMRGKFFEILAGNFPRVKGKISGYLEPPKSI